MKKNKIYWIFFLIEIFFASCEWEKEVKYDAEIFPPKIVVNCYFTPDSLWQVNITESQLMSDDDEAENVENAIVIIYEGASPIDTLQYALNGNYISISQKPEYEKEYTLTVEVPGFETVTAKGSAPQKADIKGFYLDTIEQLITNDWDWGTSSYYVQDLIIEINDDGQESNFYYFKKLIGKRKETIRDEYVDSINAYTYHDTIYYADLDFENTDPAYSNSGGNYFFTDDFFNGKQYPLKNSIKADDIVSSRDTLTKVIIYFQAISEDYYLFKLTRNQYPDESGFSEPQNCYTNIENGLGIFAGYSTYVDSVDVN